jgi:hypothetical protein
MMEEVEKTVYLSDTLRDSELDLLVSSPSHLIYSMIFNSLSRAIPVVVENWQGE